MIRKIWAKHHAHLTNADREAAAQRLVAVLVEKLPRAKLLELLPKLENVSSIDIAIALGDLREERQRRAEG
jgi:hypothetical protein